MLEPGNYIAENNDDIISQYKIVIGVKETAKCYLLRLINFDSRYSGGHIKMIFAKSPCVVVKKDKSMHCMKIWSDTDFTIYPHCLGIPYRFRKIEVIKKGVSS